MQSIWTKYDEQYRTKIWGMSSWAPYSSLANCSSVWSHTKSTYIHQYTIQLFHTTRVLCDVQDLYLTLRYYSDRASIKQKQTVKNCPVLWHFRLIQPFFPSQPSSSEAKPVPLSAANSPSWPQRSRGNDTFPRQKTTQGRLEMHHALELQRVKPMLTHVPGRENMKHDIIYNHIYIYII